jgi:hypothetical protein
MIEFMYSNINTIHAENRTQEVINFTTFPKYVQCPQTITEYDINDFEIFNFKSIRVKIEIFLLK